MFYELRTHELRPGTLSEAERRLAELPAAEGGGPVARFRTEFGALNELVELRALAGPEPRPPAARAEDAIADLRQASAAERFAPLPFSPPFDPARGPEFDFYEMRTYTYASEDDLDRLAAAWRAALPARLALGPVVAIWRSEPASGGRFVHIWPYRSLDARTRLRREIRARGEWPPGAVAERLGLPPYRLLRQENRLLVPSPAWSAR